MKPTDTRWSNRGDLSALPIDLLVVVAFVLVVDALVSTVAAWPFLRVVLGLPVLFFLPGYVLLAALYPEAGPGRELVASHATPYEDGGLPFATRIALSFGLSVALIPIYSILLSLSPVGFGASSILALLTVHVVLGAVVGAVRRLRLPEDERLRIPATRWAYELVAFVTGGSSRLNTAVNVLLVLAIVLAASGFAYAVFAPSDGAEYTDFMLLTRSGDGEYVSSGYPENYTRGSAEELVFAVANHHSEPTEYTVVVELQRVRGEGETLQIVERSELSRYGATVQPNETWYRPHDVSPTLAGDDLRLVYYLYRGDAPADPTMDTADDYLQLWIDVSIPSGSNQSDGQG